jgi:hypothetical protein
LERLFDHDCELDNVKESVSESKLSLKLLEPNELLESEESPSPELELEDTSDKGEDDDKDELSSPSTEWLPFQAASRT